MIYQKQLVKLQQTAQVVLALAGLCFGSTGAAPDAQRLDDLLARTGTQVSAFVDQFSDVKCTELVRQEKLNKDDKPELKEESTFDYLVILTNDGGELNLAESRLPVHVAKPDKKNRSMLLSNGFATLFLVFHPLYAGSFKFALAGEESINGHVMNKVSFQHVPGTRSVAALALRGREYPLELSGMAWIDAETGSIAKMEAGIEDTLQDVGLKSFRSEIEFAPMPFADSKPVYWFPTQASVEVETPKQHWRNLHRFTEYKKFSVTTEQQEKVPKK
jgi:hypothetical protein